MHPAADPSAFNGNDRLQREAAASTHKRSVYSINQAGGMRQMADNMAEDAARPLSPAQQHEEEEEHVEAADVEVLLRDRAEVSWAGMNDADAASTASSKGRSTNGDESSMTSVRSEIADALAKV